MKKEESIYHLLSDLPRVVAAQENQVTPAVPAPREAGCDEVDAFQEAMKDVKEIIRNHGRVMRKASKTQSPGWEGSDGMRQLQDAVRDRRSFSVVNMPEYMEGHEENINPLTMEKLRNGEFSVRKTLDLHGYTVPDAYLLFQDFIMEAVHSGLNCVKVIHGRGLKSKEGPILKENLKGWIVRAMHRKWVVAFASSRMCEGGPGATCILLRNRPEKKRIRIAG